MKKVIRAAARPEWVRQFAYRLMLCKPELDTASATVIADSQFDAFSTLEPETAAERHTDRRRSPDTRRLFGIGEMQGMPDFPRGDLPPGGTAALKGSAARKQPWSPVEAGDAAESGVPTRTVRSTR